MDDVTIGLALWGAVLSTALGFLKVWEFWHDRFRIEVVRDFSSDEERGNKITIRNLNSYPVILGYWELLWVSGHWPFRNEAEISAPELDDLADTRIEAHSPLTLTFSGMDHFDWDAKARQGRRMYIRLHLAGRRPLMKKVYG